MPLRGHNLKPKDPLQELRGRLINLELEITRTQQRIQQETHNLRELRRKIAENGFTAQVAFRFDDILQSFEDLEKRLQDLEFDKQQTERSIGNHYKKLLAGGFATSVGRLTVAPIDRVKLTAQINQGEAMSLRQTVTHIFKEEGWLGFWRGNGMNCLRVFPKGGCQFLCYDHLKIFFEGYLGEKNYRSKLASGMSSAAIAETITFPLDVVRMKLIKRTSVGLGTLVKEIVTTEGLGGFFTGYTASLASLVPFVGLNFATYDMLRSSYTSYTDGRKPGSLQNLALGGLSAGSVSCVCYPLDTVRRNLMVSAAGDNMGIADKFRNIYASRGFLGLYRGFVPSMLKIMPQQGIRFMAFEKFKDIFGVTVNSPKY